MSFIQFESEREKEKARQDLREVREQMLDAARKRAEQRVNRDTNSFLKGETNWMLPAVKDKMMNKNKGIQKSKKNHKKHSKKSKKKSHKKRKHSTSEDESESSISDSSSGETSDSAYKKHTKLKKVKKNAKVSKTKYRSSSSEETDDKHNPRNSKKPEEPLKRDNWMTDTLLIKTYSKERVDIQSNKKQQIDDYDPAHSTRELNPYWKITGTGLPSFQKPKDEDDCRSTKLEKSMFSHSAVACKGWRKNIEKTISKKCSSPPSSKSPKTSDQESLPDQESVADKHDQEFSEFLTDQQMNELGAKILKAEIMGNMGLAEELRGTLEKARTQRNILKDRKKAALIEDKQYKSNRAKTSRSDNNIDEHILLTHTDQAGHSRPLPTSKVLDPKDLYGGNKKKKQKRVNCHDESGKRVRYFADDDRYDIKQMFEREKYTSASDVNLEFANVAGNRKNPNDDLDDIFAEKICRDDAASFDRNDRNKAIRDHKKMEAALDNCDKCFDSTKMQKELLVCVGENVHLALPWYQGLQPDHCMIIPNQHVSCCTHIDEDTWTEINEFRKALTCMFAAQHKDVIFFEIANKLYRRPHLVIHCIPIRESDGEMAPFYFKKAIEESEHEWCVNKQLVTLRNKSLRNSIPKGLPYFWVNFGMDTGFAHVIEDEERFPVNFAQEIIGGLLNLDANKWRRQQKEHNVITKVKSFANCWKKFDCTK